MREGSLSVGRAEQAIEDLLDLRLARYPRALLLPQIWLLRQNLSAYDAAYIVLAGKLRVALITRDRRLSSAPGHGMLIEVF